MMDDLLLTLVLTFDAALRVSTPLILASMAGLFAERSGIVDIGLEGKMLASAFAAASAATVLGSPWIGLMAGVIVSCGLSMLHGFATITHKGDQIVSGVAINILAAGMSIILGLAWFGQGGLTPTLTSDQRFHSLSLPGIDIMDNIPLVGTIYRELISGHNVLVYLAFIIVPIVWWVVYRTRFGLRLRAVGENPKAVDTAGLSVTKLRYKALLVGGILCGIAGAYLSIAHNAQFTRDMTAGQGFIALAALIFGKWKPYTVLSACLLFGFLDAVAVRLQGVVIPGIGEIPVQLIESTPYLLTVILLAGFIGKAVPPKSVGVPYIKEL
jgi:simple sugar transport system permease protein